jgi:hypothetical protein
VARRRLVLLCRTSRCLGMSCGSSSTTSPHPARLQLLRLRRASGCLGSSRGSSSTTSPTSRDSSRGSSPTTSSTPHVRVPRHVARPVVRLVVDYFANAARPVPRDVARLVVDYFAYVACSAASACRVAHRAARRRLLHLRHMTGCLGTSRGSSTTSPRASRRRLLRIRRASGCLGTSRGSSLTTSPTPHVQVPRHIARLVVDYFAYAACLGVLTDKRRIHLRSASVRTYTFFTTGFPRFLSIHGARRLQAFDLPLLTNYSNPNYD